MTIAINATPVFKKPRSGVEEYSFQLIRHLAMLPQARKHRFFLYVPTKFFNSLSEQEKDFWKNFPDNFYVRPLYFPKMWTQVRLSWQMLFHLNDLLFIPAHILPLVHPKNSVVTVHGLEYEHCPAMYPPGHLEYLRLATKYSARHARKVIAVSESTKNDLIEIYKVPGKKIKVVYHGFTPSPPGAAGQMAKPVEQFSLRPYILYLGRIETKKNISGILEAFGLLKEKYKIPHQLIFAGLDGYGAERLKLEIRNLEIKNDIFLTGYVDEKKKLELLQGADLFLFPSFYEGFGLPILEAQSHGVPVVTSNISSMPEIGGKGVVLVDPKNPENIAGACWRILNDKSGRDKLITQGFNNLLRFSWEKCASQTLSILLED